MIEKIFRLGKETAVYGLSTVVGRLLNFLIVPFYANVLLPAENGIISNIYAYIAFVTVLFTYGMEPAYMRFVTSLEIGNKKQNFTVPFLSLLITSVLFAAAIHWNAAALCGLIGVDRSYFHLIQYSGWILCFDALSIIPFAFLRMEQKAKIFASLKVMNISINLVLNLVLILVVGMHAEGVFLANVIASSVTFVIMLGIVFSNFTFQLPRGLYKDILKFGLPYIPAGLAGIAMQVIDRPIVKALTNDATLGIYQINYRLGIFMMLIVGMFDYAWRPFFLHHAKEPDAKKLFAKVFTYYVLGAMCIFLPVSFFVGDLVRLHIFGKQFFPPIYWPGVSIVPWVLLAYVFTGAYTVFVVGVYLEKKTKYLPFVTGAGAVLNVGANFFLIPRIGILGGALSTLLSYIVMAGGMYYASQKFYYVTYEWKRIIRLVSASAAVFVCWLLLGLQPLTAVGTCIKLLLLLVFAVAIAKMDIIDKEDIASTKAIVRKIFTRSTSSDQ
jgi:O-antigen/teichoic acid export membrane protein